MTLDILIREPWMGTAKCAGNPDTYLTANLPRNRAHQAIAAQQLCAHCPVLKQCGTWALNYKYTNGVVMAGVAIPNISHGGKLDGRIKAAHTLIAHNIDAPPPTEDTPTTNYLRKPSGTAAINAEKTHCKSGHEFTETNTIRRKGRRGIEYRSCRKCKYEQDRKYQTNRRAQQPQERIPA